MAKNCAWKSLFPTGDAIRLPREKKKKNALAARTLLLLGFDVEYNAFQQPTAFALYCSPSASIINLDITSIMRTSISSMAKYGLLALLSLLALTQLTCTFAQRQAKEQDSLFKQIQSSGKGFIDVDTNEFSQIIQVPRDYAVTALLTTTTGSIKCPPCQAFQPEFEKLTQQWNKNKSVKSKNVFVKVEFNRAQGVFARYQLQHAPVLYTFPVPTATDQSPEHISFDFNARGFSAEEVASHLNKLLKTKFSYKQPLNTKLITATITGVITLAGSIFFLAPYIPALFSSAKPLWMILCIGAIVFNSGLMRNSIRGAPYIAAGQGGKPEYFAGGFQNQYGVETQIVAAIYSLLAFSFIALTVLVPSQRDPVRQRAGVYVWSAIFLVTFSLLFYIFRIKNPSYPFRLFF